METKHTPGPWELSTISYDNYPTCIVRAPFYTDAVHWRKPKAGLTRAERDQQNADARLIAAAPEMLDILIKLAVDLDGDVATWSELWDKARAIIAKATGETVTA